MGGVLCCCSEPVDFDAEVNLFQFDLHRVVGKGAFGKVRVVEHKLTKNMYALKYIDKAKCIRQRAIANIIQERRLLEEIDHPFIVNMRYAFQDDENCFFVLDLMLGGDLRFHLERNGHLEEKTVRFWVAEIACALEYLHRQRIIHRDLKPDNILLDEHGHAHITDFNVAIHYSERRMHTSVAGSMAYMAPEVVGKKGYTWCIDYWSLGVCAWELIFHKRPFEGRSQESLTRAIMKDPLAFPDNVKDRCSADGVLALRGLLDRNSSRRLGCRPDGQGFKDIQEHPWFAGFDWDLLQAKEVPPPFIPDEKKPNFDVSHELDEFLMVDKPLSAHKRKANPDFDKMKPELRELEEHFTVYDFRKSRRISYYPHNQQLVTTIHGSAANTEANGEASIDPAASIALQSQNHTTTLVHTIAEPSRAGTPVCDVERQPPLPSASLLPPGEWGAPIRGTPSRKSVSSREGRDIDDGTRQ